MPRKSSPRARKLHSKRERIAREMGALDVEIRRLEGELRSRRGKTRRAAGFSLGVLRKPNARRFNDITVKDAIVTLLKQRRRPMHYKDITETLLREGRYRTKSKNFLSTVAITIMRDKRLKRLKPGVYALRRGA